MISEKHRLKRWSNQLFFTGPTILAFTAVILVPFLYGIYMTFFQWDGISSATPYVGFGNYAEVIRDGKFWASVWLTLKYVVATVVLINAIAFFLSYLVTSGIRGQNFFRASFFTPNLIGGLVLGFLWQFVFNNLFVTIGKRYGIDLFSKTWLGDETLAFWALVIVTVWQYAGYMMVIFIAGLMSVPRDVIEAAKIDGTGAWKQLTHMVLPLMVPSFIVTIFLSLQRGFMVYDVNYALTGGGPFGSTVMASMHVYDKAFVRFDYGVGQAEAFVLFFLVAGVTLVQVYLGKKMEVEA
ncbi:sugar ABC transporter permease [Paenibacillus sp.]|uniref:carbohydrate ABC transporter permease n=1 Tax=Paenibacillus sp. TaxID=58172 RepID=UPI002D73155C|nr:sugar ABC transporter permease [Paenibacillus sp.]HZG58885.1 sugar ABC transporter permease [Paenibacillus sp.]